MRKPDDDLKIDISDLFGGELSGPSDTLEDSVDTPASPAGASPVSTEAESQFRQWMDNRAVELEAKSLELERRHQQAASAAGSASTGDTITGGELLAAQPAPPPPPPPSPASPIDFNEPMTPPFMGLTPVSAAPPKEAAKGPAPAVPGQEAAQPAAETAAPAPDPEELKKTRAELEFLMLYDEFRNIIIYELKDLVGEKKTFTMLTRTVEMAREKYPMIFRNANWNAEGNLLEDGGVDSHRLLENKNALDSPKADETMDMALSSLLKLRLQAVEKGLGTGLKNKIRARMYQWISEKTQKAANEGKDSAVLKRLNGYVAST